MARVSVSDKDRGWKRILGETKKLEAKPVVKIGVQGADATERKQVSTPAGLETTALTVVEIANFHEFGLGRNPERSFLRETVDQNRSKYVKITEAFKKEIFGGKLTTGQALGMLGEKIKSDVQQRITDGIAPALSPETIERKGSDVPLIDTGQLRQSITWVLEEKSQ
jgi:hypothetical protein